MKRCLAAGAARETQIKSQEDEQIKSQEDEFWSSRLAPVLARLGMGLGALSYTVGAPAPGVKTIPLF